MTQLLRRSVQLGDGLSLVAGCLILIMSFLSAFEVVMRYFLNLPTFWSLELSQYLMLLVAWLSAPGALFRHSHISVDFVMDHVSPSWRRVLLTVGTAYGLFYCLSLFWQTIPPLRMSVQFGFHTAGNLTFPMSWPYLAILAGSALFACAFLVQGLRIWVGGGS